MAKVFVRGLILLVAMASVAAAEPGPLSHYRTVALGDSVATVLERLQLQPADVKVLYEQTSLVQELTWRPHRFISGTTVAPDPLGEIVMTFHVGRLARIVATYERQGIQGLTDSDLLELLTNVYGVPLLPSRSIDVPLKSDSVSERHVVAQWADADADLLLWSEDYPRLAGLMISARASAPALQAAMAEGARRLSDGAPQRARDKQAAAAAAILERDARIRVQNKATFKP
jgi:hypothetical protein